MSQTQVIFSEAELAKRENVSPRTVMRWRATGDGPPFIRIGLRRVGYRLSDIEKWEASRTFAHHAAEAASKISAAHQAA